MSEQPEQVKVWKFLVADHRLRYGDERLVEVGKPLSVEGEIIVCERGIHGCERALDALIYAPGAHLAYGVLSGDLHRGVNKVAGRTFVAEKIIDATRVLQEFTLWCANEAIKAAKNAGIAVDPRSEEALAVVRRFLDSEATKDELDAAYAAADAAADAAAYAAARAAARKAQADKLEQLLKAEMEK